MFMVVSRRRSPSIVIFAIWSRIFSRSPSVRSLTFLEYGNAAGFADLARAGATDAENGGQADFSVLCGGMLMPAIRAMFVL
jgi:hypothetical protein